MRCPGLASGCLAAVGAAHLWAVSGVFGKIVMTGSLSPARLVFYRSVLSTLMLLAVLLWRDRTLLRLSRRDLPFFLAMGTLGLALTQFTYYAAIQISQCWHGDSAPVSCASVDGAV